MLQQPALWMSLTIFSVQLLFACATRSAWCASSTAWAERSWHRQESCCEPIRDGRCQRHETNETHQSRKKLGIIRHPNWCKMFIFRNWKPHPLRCSQNTCACLVQKGLQLGDALLTRATSNSGEQKSLVWQSQTAKISQDHLRSAKFPPILGAALLSPSGNPAPPTHVLCRTAPGDPCPAQRPSAPGAPGASHVPRPPQPFAWCPNPKTSGKNSEEYGELGGHGYLTWW